MKPPLLRALASTAMACTALLPAPASSHGFLSTPRARNLVAYEDRLYHGETASDPLPEDCPTCINRGGTLARCGVLNPGGGPEERNYDFPRNAFGDAMPANPQEVYEEGATIDVEVVLSAHHKGHFVFRACPIAFTTVSPTQECFDARPLTFVEDGLYGAPADEAHPERAYVAPFHHPRKVASSKPNFDRAMLFRFRMRLPPGVTGDLVLIQWYYVASNSGCAHEGYDEYPWPDDWILDMDEDEEASDWESKVSVGAGLKSCGAPGALPPDGEGVPEQFWNCAEVSIVPRGTLANPHGQLQSDKTIIGYLASWQWYDRNKFAEPWLFDYRKYTRVNFAFFQTNVQGDLWGTDSWADPNLLFGPYNWNGIEGTDTKYCSWDTPDKKVCKFHFYEKGVLHLAREAGAEVWPSIGGWSLSDPFPAMAANLAARTNFANKCIELIEEYGFDGIDIDWEYPGYEAHSGTPADTETYNLLLQLVREKLDELGERTGKFYGLTAALPCGTNHINNIDIPTAAKYLTELNLMTYDFFGAWSPTTGVNAPLYDQDWGGEDVARYSVDGCVKNWVEGGGSPGAINIGLPFYGRGYLKAKHLNEPHLGKPDKSLWWQDEGSPQYFNIVNKLHNLVSVRHNLTKTQYAYNDAIVNGVEVGGMVSYDDEEAICDKTEYCLEHDLNGFIIWEMSGDLMDDETTPLIDTVHAKLKDPSLDCREFAYDKDTFSGYATPFGNEVIASFTRPKSVATGETPGQPKMECPSPWFWGIIQWDECRSYFTCTNGAPALETLTHCPKDKLFDEVSKECKDESLVTCSVSDSDVPSPTVTPAAAIPEQSSFSGFQYDTECPPGFSSFKAGPDCTSYYRCHNGMLAGPITACLPGTLFDENLLLCNFESSVECTVTSQPTPQPTPQPTRYPVSQQPITNKPTQSIVDDVRDRPLLTPKTTRPTKNRTSPPSQSPITKRPSRQPTAKLVFNSPTSSYEIVEVEPNIALVQGSKPTNRPTRKRPKPTNRPTRKRPKPTNRPTRKRPTHTKKSGGGNTMASSPLNKPTASSFAVMSHSEPSVIEYNPSKGEEEHVGNNIKNQITQQQAKLKKAKKAKRGKKGIKRQKKKKRKQKKQNKRQQKKIPKTQNRGQLR